MPPCPGTDSSTQDRLVNVSPSLITAGTSQTASAVLSGLSCLVCWIFKDDADSISYCLQALLELRPTRVQLSWFLKPDVVGGGTPLPRAGHARCGVRSHTRDVPSCL